MHYRRLILVACLLFTGAVSGIGLAQSDGAYSIDPDTETEIPETTITYSGSTYTFTTVTSVFPGDSIQADTQGPDDTGYFVYLVDKSEAVRRSEGVVGNGSLEFDLTGLSPGTYALVSVKNNSIQALHPVIVDGYSISQSYSSEVRSDGSLNVSVELDREVSGADDPEEVVVSVWNETNKETVTATETSKNTYTANVQMDAFSAGDYSVVTRLRGPDEVYGQPELIGVSDRTSVTVTTPTPTPTVTNTSTPTPTPATDTPTPTSTQTTTDTKTQTVSPTPSDSPRTDTITSTPTETGQPPTDRESNAPAGEKQSSASTESSETDTPPQTTTMSQSETAAQTASEDATPTPTSGTANTATPTAPPTATVAPTTNNSTTPRGETTTPQATQPGFGLFVTLLTIAMVIILERSRQS
jgi:hypothetical protein